MGRLLISLILYKEGLLEEPILYLSVYFKQNRNVYYDLLQQVRLKGTWETWLEFFLEGVTESAKQAVSSAKKINLLFEEDLLKIQGLGRRRLSCIEVLEYLKTMPQTSVPSLSRDLSLTPPTIRSTFNSMLKLGILEEITGKQRDKVYVYRKYLDILSEGVDPL